ncbi:MAG: CPBP family intramembrane metalloprotease [Hormoscilla sp. GM102CHS1]|nr:CPBP family intramembrane metalloprotease [Hormoscilla sp. GM102CHS1]
MTIKRFILGALTVLALALVGLSLYSSWSQPQFQGRLELYETNLLLQASEWQGGSDDGRENSVRDLLLGSGVTETALQQYLDARSQAQSLLDKLQMQLPQSADPSIPGQISQLHNEIDRLDLRLGILQIATDQTFDAVGVSRYSHYPDGIEAAMNTWDNLSDSSRLVNTAILLEGLWKDPPRFPADAEIQINEQLDGWFRYQALSRLYQLQKRQDLFGALSAAEQEVAQEVFFKLVLASGIQTLAAVLGTGLLIFILVQRLLKGKESLWTQNVDLSWFAPWDLETILQVLVVGFFFVGQIIITLILQLLPIDFAAAGATTQAFYILVNYLLLALGGLLVLVLSVKQFLPLPRAWFRFDWLEYQWLAWGLGGFLAAMPLVIAVSLINQQFWQGQGGSNPILPLALQGREPLAIAIFFLTASVAAPVFEEIIFRGFLLPSLTRYFPLWGAIAFSSLLFSVVHLNLSEVLPLMTLGMVLGFVYTRSGNLLAPILLHGLWNSSTLFTLFLLGSGANG